MLGPGPFECRSRLQAMRAVSPLALVRALAARRHRFCYESSGHDPQLPALLSRCRYERHELATSDGAILQGVLRRPVAPAAPTMLFFPGNATHQLATFIPVIERIRAERDFGVAMFAYRGYDGSSGKPSPRVARADARAQHAWLRSELGLASRDIALSGYSMGSGLALRLASELCARDEPPAALVLLSPYWTLPLGPAHALRLLVATHHYRVEDALPSLRGPVRVVAGARDEALPVAEHARRLARALGDRADYLELAAATHTDYLEDADLLASEGSWMAERTGAVAR
jgi:pimeloyl-ACP methyl ester carboxylesterase